jgi:hypothetical protein
MLLFLASAKADLYVISVPLAKASGKLAEADSFATSFS